MSANTSRMASVGAKRPVKVVSACRFYDLNSLKRHKATEQNTAAGSVHSSKNAQQQRWRFNPLNAPFKTFKTQKEAFEFLDKQPCSQILRTFARELSATGQREFIVSSAELFWQHYKALPADGRHHYEIIRQSSPCHLYFDLEYVPQVNPGLHGPSLVDVLVSGIATELQQQYNIPWHDSYVLELDSSTPHKFSRHLIVRLPGLAFADACQAGRFARLLVLRLLQKGLHSCKHSQLLVQDKDSGGLTCFVDMAVYTRNRAFRLYLSSKFGKQACLRLTSRYGGATLDPKQAFGQLLISVLHGSTSRTSGGSTRQAHALASLQEHWYVQQPKQVLEKGTFSMHNCRRQFAGVDTFAQRRQQQQQTRVSLLYVDDIDWQQELQQLPLSWQQVAMLQLHPAPHNQQLQDLPSAALPNQQWNSGAAAPASGASPMQGASAAGAGAAVCYGPSPYPLLEHFILTVCNQGGMQGDIRSWLSLPGCVVFNIKNNRWCGNIERPHKSNGIYYVADLATGVYYQKCYDPNCRSYRSPCLPLPLQVWDAYRQDRPGTTSPQAAAASNPITAAAGAGAVGTARAGTAAVGTAGAAAAAVCSMQKEQAEPVQSNGDDELCLQLLQEFESQQQLQLC